jgi:hypothetical protein
MDALSNQVAVPLGIVRAAWLKFAVPGLFGRVVSSFRLELSDDGEIRVRIRTECFKQTNPDTTKIPWADLGATDQREQRVTEKLKERAADVYVICPVAQLSGDIRDGFVDKTSIVFSEERVR